MNKLIKKITVQFYSIEVNDSFFDNFVSNYKANKENFNSVRILTLRLKKYLIKISTEQVVEGSNVYAATVVRERNTWQTKATSDGKITGISLNQGIIGDPYFFFVIPAKKIVLGLTTGPSGSLKSVAKAMLDQFNSNRLEQVKLDLIPKKKEFSALKELPEDSILHFKLNPSYLSDVSDDAPQIIRDLSSAPYIENSMQLTLQLDVGNSPEKSVTKDTALEIISYLSDHEGCSLLKVKGTDEFGDNIHLDFGNAFVNYKTEVSTRNKFLDEEVSLEILKNALTEYLQTADVIR